jgi:endo-1,4-beta-xylanase
VDAVWRTVAPHATTRVIFGSPPSAADLSATWRALSDAANLYLLVEVRDDAARNDSADAYQDDSVELYLDVGDDKTGAFGDDDFQFYFRRGVNVVRETRHKATDGVSYNTRSLRGGGVPDGDPPALENAPTA